MTSLAPLHQRLHRLIRRRRRLRWLAGLAPLATALFWFLAGAFVLDWLFHLNQVQRGLLWLAGAAAFVWAYRRYGWPWVRAKESELDVALWVERKAHVDTDVVAALQFESPEAPNWGSVQLEQAVIEQAAQLAPQLPMDEGLPKKPIQRRSLVLAGTLAGVVLVWLLWPAHVETFLARLFLSNRHYPTRTQIAWVEINGQRIPAEATEWWVVEGQPLNVRVVARGELPAEGRMELTLLATQARTEVPLQPLSPLSSAGSAKGSPSGAPQESFLGSAQKLPSGSASGSSSGPAQKSPSGSAKELEESAGAKMPPDRSAASRSAQQEADSDSGWYGGQVDRLSDPAWMKIYLGDAWTEPIQLRLTPLPRIELLMEVEPPEYAQEADVPKGRFPGLCQLAVVEGSRVRIHISADKRLQEAWVQIDEKTYSMSPAQGGLEEPSSPTDRGPVQWWTLPPAGTPLEAVVSPLRFTIHVKDEHDLTMEHPVQGFLRILPDLAPKVTATQRTPRILPTARPRIRYEASDDFGIGKLSLVRQVVRSDGSSQEDEVPLYELASGEKPQKTQQAAVQVSLETLHLKPGDQLRLTVRVEDYRGDRPGQAGLSEPLVFQVTDLAGILAAITEADRQLVQEYQEMIDRQLEIGGEKP